MPIKELPGDWAIAQFYAETARNSVYDCIRFAAGVPPDGLGGSGAELLPVAQIRCEIPKYGCDHSSSRGPWLVTVGWL